MAKKAKTFKSLKKKSTVVTEVELPPVEVEQPVVPEIPQAAPDPMMILMQATAQLAQGINTMLEGQKVQTDALISIKDSLVGQESARKLSEEETRALAESKPLHTESRTYYIQPLMGYDVDQKPVYNDAIGPTFKNEEEANAFGNEKIGVGKFRTYHVSSVAAMVT